MFAEQGQRWAAEDLTPAQRNQVERYAALVAELQAETTATLALADELAPGTIETALATSDLELGIETLLYGGSCSSPAPWRSRAGGSEPKRWISALVELRRGDELPVYSPSEAG
ncbi:hypothetical protein SAMN05216276_108620 [Streptosporangium subroseum]|uniref:Uncharacterized protein n=1 Tax=Streptosporangium subroseum TaxID=106412 RepID=A0A239P5H6_9ACTN|nr:hypothetical protein [Streptosporangium subroseum]SNT61924.1 hypothetical protein SAMN05216276_108620 [Streptosporangium subroseum]